MERKLSKTLGELLESVRHMNVDIMPFARALGAAEDLEKLVEKAGAGEHVHVALSLGEVIEKLEPVPDDQDAALLVEAVVSAGSTAQRVRATTVLGAVLTIMALVVRNILRGR